MSRLETAFIGLGGNLGDVVATMSGALQQLDAHPHIEVDTVSPVYRTPPWGIEDQEWFHNACAKLSTTLEPFELLKECLKIERFYKRERMVRWGPRTLDLDILVFGNRAIKTDKLTIPHPRISQRSFVVKPLEDIAPQLEIEGKLPSHWLESLKAIDLEHIGLAEDWWKPANGS